MSRLEGIFRRLRFEGRKALIPFLVAGDPSLEATRALLSALPPCGVELAEIGFPYSDPIADGPTIQAAYTRALSQGVTVENVLAAARAVTASSPLGLVGMASYALVYRWGVERWVAAAAAAGLAGLIVPDLPCEEAASLGARCRAEGLGLVQLIAPTTTGERIRRIVEQGSGFLYYVSVAGVTGERASLPTELRDRLTAIRALTDLPICVGFGLRDADQIREIAPFVDGVIVGSALVRRVAAAIERHSPLAVVVEEIAGECRALYAALQDGGKPS